MRIVHILTVLSSFFFISPVLANEQPHNTQPFGDWLSELRDEARSRGYSDRLISQALTDLEPLPRVIALDRKQPESTMTMDEYLKKVLPQSRIDKAREKYRDNEALLKRVSERYGVPPQYIVALWGIESNFGERMGDFEIVEALATLAYDGRRSAYFRKELFNALTILQEGHIDYMDMLGSWAGAMGQCQFMPTSFINYAVDFDGDGRKDIWGTEADVFASIANYLSSEGWNTHGAYGSPEQTGSNFNVILKWNRSRYFATAVGMLAEEVEAAL